MSQPIHAIGNAHLDPIWLWRWQEGCNEALQTFRSALDRLEEYPGFVFTCSSASYYRWVEEIDPAMFAEIQTAVKKGRWVPVNGWWVQPDCNMPSGESFARHALYSQLYYHEKFGRICKTGYNVDSFGHNAMLPQLLRQAGMNAYVFMRPSMGENPNIPQNAFWWESPDGTRVLTYRLPTGYGESGPGGLTRTLEFLRERGDEAGHGMMLFYGVGNHGGGPTKADIEHLTGKMKEAGFEELQFSSPDDYFSDLVLAPLNLPVWKDDFQHHASGCYAATSMIKQLNRRAEQELYFAEAFDTAAAKRFGLAPKTAELKEAWLDVAFNQFHDIFCGCSIREAYDDVRDSMGHACTVAARSANQAMLRFARSIDTWVEGVSDPVSDERRAEIRHRGIPSLFPRPVVLFNALSWEREVPVRVLYPAMGVETADHVPVPFQNVTASRFDNPMAKDTLFVAKLPPLGYTLYWLYPMRDLEEYPVPETAVAGGETADGLVCIENENLRAEFDPATGGIARLTDKTAGRTLAGDLPFAVPTVINDIEADTWAHNVFRFHDIKGTMDLVSLKLLEKGPARALVQAKYSFGRSTLLQEFSLTAGAWTVRVECKALWAEDFTMLKIPLPLTGAAPASTYEIPNGYLKRPCNGEEEPGLAWADLTVTDEAGQRHGVAVMSDSKYSYDCPVTDGEAEGGEPVTAQLRLTVLRNVIFADHCAQRPEREFNFTDEGLQRFTYEIYPHEGEAEQSDVTRQAYSLCSAPFVVQESYHQGTAPAQESFLRITAENVIATAFKFCEDGSGDLILRCYETKGLPCTRTAISLPMADAAFWADFSAHEIKTFRIGPDGRATQVNFLEGVV
ncbi:MAG: alpha-mannosidase [Oscillospiraceae bacterium]|jgi:alpha-mannosidase|nr:alpha-mannosidase [Oscillospiraceae bacterium]